jgi:biopolymer transport protein ExbB
VTQTNPIFIMKRFVFVMFVFLSFSPTMAQDESPVSVAGDTTATKGILPDGMTLHEVIREQFINGTWEFMTPVLVCLLLGLAISIERIIRLNLANINSQKLVDDTREVLENEGLEPATDKVKKKKTPMHIVFKNGLEKYKESLEMAEKAVIAHGSAEMGRLEKRLVWISLFIAIAPMLGFMGTVIGMINAFDAIEAAGDISPTLVASGIKVALLTTVAGLIVAIILQLFYNYCVARIDGIVNHMEWASMALIDILADDTTRKLASDNTRRITGPTNDPLSEAGREKK